jgi:hypothetical protein
MGTRSSVIIFQDGKAKGYYNQYDGYPEGLGTDVIKELKKDDMVEKELIIGIQDLPMLLQEKHMKKLVGYIKMLF